MPRAYIRIDLGPDGPGSGDVVVGCSLDQAGTVVEMTVDKSPRVINLLVKLTRWAVIARNRQDQLKIIFLKFEVFFCRGRWGIRFS